MKKFEELQLSEGMLNSIKLAGFSEPSEIQEKTIPLVVSGKDIVGSSATGSGKTLAFGAGIIDKIKRGLGIQSLILTPTRELAEQVAATLRKFSQFKALKVKDVYGGVPINPQMRDLQKAEIVVGTPGRILDHLQRRTINLSKVKYLVLDEADRMLDMGFIKDVEKILQYCPQPRQTLLFSATISPEIKSIAKRHMREPVQIAVNNQVDPSKLHQCYYDVASNLKFSLLVHLLKLEKKGVAMIFCNTRRNVDRLTQGLEEQNIQAKAIHGGLSQNRRSDTLQSFHEKENLILVCTDVAARGLDIKGITHVYNFDIPATDIDYIHRIGRTARAGKDGIAISFVSSGDHTEFKQISKSMEIQRINVPKIENIPPINFSSNDDRRTNRKKGRNSPRKKGFNETRTNKSKPRFKGNNYRKSFNRR